ncbi:hypothetical protein ES703_24523 [subsurface metagenome]
MKKIITMLALILMVMLLPAAVSCGTRGIDPDEIPMEAVVVGELVLVDGNLRVNQTGTDDSFLLIWPDFYSRGGETLIISPSGKTVTRVSDIVTVSGEITSAAVAAEHVGPMLPEVAEGPYWLVKEVVNSSTTASNPLSPEKLEELAERYRDSQYLFNWAVYAEEYGITLKEAVGRFSLTDDAGLLGTALEELEKETFAGLWVEGSQVIVAFTEGGEGTIKGYVEENSPLARKITLRTLGVSFEELRSAQQEASQLLQNLGVPTSSFVDVVKNRVVLLVTDAELFRDTLTKAGVILPDYVVPDIIYEPADEAPPGINPDPSVHFPQLKTRSGSFMLALLVGELTLDDGYLRVGDSLIIWQPDYFVNNNDGTIEVLDRNGDVVARVGEEVRMGGGEIKPIEHINKLLKEPLPQDCEGPYWLMGEIVPMN